MSPGGHLATTAVACAASHALTGCWPLTAAIATGGFLIDVDHAVDYVLFERERALTPGAFLRHYVEGRTRRVVLLLHSYEVFALLGLAAWWTQSVPLLGYLVGALMHLALDVVFNGRLTPRSISAFYSFAYRAAHRFDADGLLGRRRFAPAGAFWPAFFRGSALAGGAPPRRTRQPEPTLDLARYVDVPR
jgi:hypothetical protein